MERLTKHWGSNYVATKLNYDCLCEMSKEDFKHFEEIIKKLAEYEDLEEQGKLELIRDSRKKLTEEQALEKLNFQELFTTEEAKDILYSLRESVSDRAINLPKKILGEYSYYEGEFNGMNIAIKLLEKLK